MKLLTLTLQNFQGIKSFTLDTEGNNIVVLGRNGAGKTTISNGFQWLLFGKDSTGRSPENQGFALKTRDKNGDVVSGLEHAVEGTFEHDGKTITLKKVFTEKWSTKRGSAKKEFGGHETAYWVDEVPYKQKDYDAFIASIVDEEKFRLVSDPMYFNKLDWKKRREIMLALCSDITDADVFSANPELEIIKELIEAHGPEKGKALLMERRKNWNAKREQIPVRIDEANRGLEAPAATMDIDKLKTTRSSMAEEKQKMVSQVQNAAKTASEGKQKIYSQINNVTMQLNKNRELRRDAEHQQQLLKSGLERHNVRIKQAQEAIEDIEKRIVSLAEEIATRENLKKELGETWKAVKQMALVPDVATECPTCGQELPEDQLQQKQAEVIKKLTETQSKDLAAIVEKGSKNNDEIKRLQARMVDLEGHKSDQAAVISKAMQELEAEKVQAETPLPDNSKEDEALEAHIAKLREEADKPIEAVDTSELDAAIKAYEDSLAEIDRAIANQDNYAKAQERIKTLLEEESKIGAELAMVEGQILAVEKFITTKADMQEGALNKMFKNVTFKLFERQVNDGINPTFVTLINGVPYLDANTAGQINAGLEIIDYLCDAYNFRSCVMIDHMESVTDLYPIKSQVIGLKVSKDHARLTTEVS